MNVIKKWILGNCHYAAAEIRSASIVVLRHDDGEINQVYAELRQPDVIFHCCVKPEIAYARLLEEKGLPYYGSGMDMDLADSRAESCLKYEQMMTKAYDDALPHNMGYFRLDTNRPEKEIFKDVKREISRRLGE